MSKIGIAISTRNRQKHLKICLAHFVAYYPQEHKVTMMVCDDNSDLDKAQENQLTCAYWGVDYKYHDSRIGVARNKNFGLSILQNNDVVFLFDDDCFPNDNHWVDSYVEIMKQNDVHHLTYTPWEPSQRTEADGMYVSEWGMGCCLFFSKSIIEKIGGFEEQYHMFGYEHLSYARHAFASGMNQKYGAYLTPKSAIGRIFSLDYEYQVLKQHPSLCDIDFQHSRISYKDTPADVIRLNRQRFEANKDKLYVALPTV